MQAGLISGTVGCGAPAPANTDDSAPIILDGGSELTVSPGALVTLTASNDGSGATTSTSYAWTQVFGPPVDFGDGLGESISFNAPTPPRQEPILLSFEILIVSDGLETRDTLNMTVDPVLVEGKILYSEVEDDQSGTEESSDGGPPQGDTDEISSPPNDYPADGESDFGQSPEPLAGPTPGSTKSPA
ncbi:MAG: hypothetical protein IH988_03995 [Planctomycetes bacterium]|nr:hypothetical protein [Planctomycetota bacterium]